jgi:TRAP-type C4-dicarboxylate transport system substrate-binding protein
MATKRVDKWIWPRLVLGLIVPWAIIQPVYAETQLSLIYNYCSESSPSKAVDKFAELVATKTKDSVRIDARRVNTDLMFTILRSTTRHAIRHVTTDVDLFLLQMVRDGQSDLAVVRTLGPDPAFRLFDLPLLINNRDDLQMLAAKVVIPYMGPLARKNGFEILTLFDGDFSQLNSRMPLTQLKDFKGLRVGTPGSGEVELNNSNSGFFRQLGADPVIIASSDVDAASRGNLRRPLGADAVFTPSSDVGTASKAEYLDAVDTSLSGMIKSGSIDTLRNVILTKHRYTPAYLIANLQWVNKLDADAQTAVRSAATEAMAFSLASGNSAEKDYIGKLRAKGVNVIPLSSEEQWQLQNESRRFYDHYAIGGGDIEALADSLRLLPRGRSPISE